MKRKRTKHRLPTGSILGTFGKGRDGSVSVNFGTSGGPNCDIGCELHPIHGNEVGCYAERVEIRGDRIHLNDKLKRHQAMPAFQVCGRALLELQELERRGVVVPWLRISTNGSLPKPAKVRGDKLFATQFRTLLDYCRQHGIPVHCPVESHKKARFYRALAGDLAVVRESTQSDKRFLTATGAVSRVAGTADQSRIERVEAARELAADRRESTGRKCIVCPAVTNSFAARRDSSLLNARAKCGYCDMCSRTDCDVVFPRH